MKTLLIVLSCSILCVGCGSLRKPYPEKSLHAIHVGDPQSPSSASAASPLSVRVDRVVMAKPYDATTFIYQVGASAFESDYYNGFIAPPGRLLTSEINAFITKSGLFKTVLLPESTADYQLSLETNVTSMYGDFRDAQKPVAVVTARFFVINQTKNQFAVIFDKVYSQSTPIEQQGPNALVKAYETCWTNVLTQLAGDLRSSGAVMNGQ